MGYQSSSGRTRFGRPRGFDKPNKTKTRKSMKHHSPGSRQGESRSRTLKETVDRTLAGLDNLGAQTFVMSPFHQHFDRWLKSLITVLDDFEGSPVVEADDGFHEERGGLLSAVEAALKAEQAKEASRGNTILGLHGSKDLLFHAERRYDAKLKEHSAHWDQRLKSLTDGVETLHAELDEVLGSEVGLLESLTKSKAKRVQEVKERLTAAEKELNAAKTSFAKELANLQSEYEHKRREILEKVRVERKEIEKLEAEAEVDGSVEVRRVACEELAEAIKALVKRIRNSEKNDGAN